MKRSNVLDALRIFAAIWVLSFHLSGNSGFYLTIPNHFPINLNFYWLKDFTQIGFLGVDIFFILSGCVIAKSSIHSTAFKFLKSRFSRIYPTYALATLLSLVLAPLVLTTLSISRGLISLSGIDLLLTNSPFIGTAWTLVFECRFYFAIFLLIILCRNNLTSKGLLVFSHLWLTLLLLSYLFSNTTYNSFVMRGYGAYFILGIFLALFESRKASWKLMPGLVIAGLLSLGKMIARIEEHQQVEKSKLIAVVVLALTLVTIIKAQFFNRKDLKIIPRKSNFIRTFALMTYPIYLFHEYFGISLIQILWVHGIPVFYGYLVSLFTIFSISYLMATQIDPYITRIISSNKLT